MINFLKWEDTIDFYNNVFTLFEFYENELKFDYFSIKYEDLIADFEKYYSFIKFSRIKI